MKLGLVFVLLVGCGGAQAKPAAHAVPAVTPEARETMCHTLIEQGVTLYASAGADKEGVPTDKSTRAVWRELYKQRLQEQGSLSEGFVWCMDKIVKHYDDVECAAGALSVAEFEQCLGIQ